MEPLYSSEVSKCPSHYSVSLTMLIILSFKWFSPVLPHKMLIDSLFIYHPTNKAMYSTTSSTTKYLTKTIHNITFQKKVLFTFGSLTLCLPRVNQISSEHLCQNCQRKERLAHCSSFNKAFLTTDGIKYYMPMF
jgi:hypothetical protein